MMLMSPLPDIDKVFSMIIQQEREIVSFVFDPISHDAPNSDPSIALMANSQYKFFNEKYDQSGKGKGQGINRVCTHCGRSNHTIETCWLKHGLPQSQSKANSAVLDSTQSDSTSSPTSTKSFCFTQEEYNTIRSLLQQSKLSHNPVVNSVSTSPFILDSQSSHGDGKSPNLWILDTRATDHITFHLAAFTTYRPIVPIPVSLPNGSQIFASISGTIVISPYPTLHNVLYISSFHVSLISVTKLAESNNCFLNFTTNSCEILQNCSKKMTGTARLERGLDVLANAYETSANTCNNVSNNSFFLWHLRLGHISDLGMQSVSKLFPFIPCKNNMASYDSCHFAKQRKFPFPSVSKTSFPFDILHADLWANSLLFLF